MDHPTPAAKPRAGLAIALLLLGSVGFAALWVLLALYADRLLGWMAVPAAADAALLLRLGGMRRGWRRAVCAIAATAMTVVLANWGIAAGQIGAAMGLLPWESLLKLGLDYAWTLAQLANGGVELAWTAAALAVAAWLGR
ncbi:hypothetical protein M2650_07210 [Luteimonas sp. SX5]|uniref:Uncharacterized protein n=1 Tax=Luteimonas galliterrae TaxID=2940486 RepID=A0ABT0MHR8_9GAMM|nr:hypothetical protein [Luteimonas galliterrae]MCL1634419.1 hypothetical protein [Luteimonas galliterrae]